MVWLLDSRAGMLRPVDGYIPLRFYYTSPTDSFFSSRRVEVWRGEAQITLLNERLRGELRELCQAHAVSGYEESFAELVAKRIRPYADEVSLDALGNVIAHQAGNGPRVMVTAHLDEIGLMVRHIDERGFLFFSPVGGNRPQNLFSRGCTVKTDDDRLVPGLINHRHPGRPRGIERLPELDEFFIDVGASGREEAEEMGIEVGNTVSLEHEFRRLGRDRLMGKALDDRALVLVQMEAMRLLAESRDAPDLYFVFTTQEEVGCRGAKTAAYSVNPDSAIALDITVANDIPGGPTRETITELDGGPAIKVMDRLSNSHMGLISSPAIVRRMKRVATEHGIPHQLEVFMAGSTDAATIHLEREGVPSGAILLPTRYVHAYEVISEQDVTRMISFVVRYLESLG